MRSARIQQDIDPGEVGFESEHMESGSGYRGIVGGVVSGIGERLAGARTRSPSRAQVRVPRSFSFGRSLLRVIVALLLATSVVGAALAFEWPRSETVRQLVARWAPQGVLDMLPSSDVQDTSAEAASSDTPQAVAGSGSSYRTMADNDEANAGYSAAEQQQMIQKLVRDVESLQQGIEQLRAGQDQMLRMMLRSPAAGAQARVIAPPRPSTTGLATGLGSPPPLRRSPALVPPPPRY